METDISFARARELAVDAFRERYARKFPGQTLLANDTGRDLGDSWAVFLSLDVDGPLVGAPVVIIAKVDGSLSVRQIPPDVQILEAPMVVEA